MGRPLQLLHGRNPAAVSNRHDGPREAVAEDQGAADVARHLRQLTQDGRDPQGGGRYPPEEPAPIIGVVAGRQLDLKYRSDVFGYTSTPVPALLHSATHRLSLTVLLQYYYLKYSVIYFLSKLNAEKLKLFPEHKIKQASNLATEELIRYTHSL